MYGAVHTGAGGNRIFGVFCRMYGAVRTGAGGSRIIGNVAICVPNYTASNAIRPQIAVSISVILSDCRW
jgi:hypothetical protein